MIDIGGIELLGGGMGVGWLLKTVVQKFFSRKKDGADLLNQNIENFSTQVELFDSINKRQAEVVKQLQEIACYRDPCRIRINGAIPKKKETEKKTKKEKK